MLYKKKIIITLFVFFVLFINMTSFSYAANSSQQTEQKRLEIQRKINSLTKLERQETNKLNKNQQKLEKNQKALKRSQSQYTSKQESIKYLQNKLNANLNQFNKRQSASAKRIRYIYKTKHSLIFDLLLSTTTMSQFLDRIYYQNLIIQSDKKKMDDLRSQAKDIRQLKQKLESERRELSKIIRDIDKENKNIQVTIRKNKSMIQKIENDKRAFERAERELARQSEKLGNIISKTTQNSGVNVTSGFILPVAGRVSSPYGWRHHPIHKVRKFHTGIDYDVPYGTPIKASNSGKVIYSGWYGGYGRVVILDHGSCTGAPTTTLYAHMSKQKVTVGQSVTRGQVVGLVGSTGYSTGPHLHFEVRINGKPQNPNNYL